MEQQYDQEDPSEDDVAQLQKRLDPNLLAAAHNMGIDINSDQIHELQKFIQEHGAGDLEVDQMDEDDQDDQADDDDDN